MISKSVLVQLIKEVIQENPSLIINKELQVEQKTGQFAAVSQLADLANNQGKTHVARYLSLAVEADLLPDQVMERVNQAKMPFAMTGDEYEALIHQLEQTWQAPAHAKMLRELLDRFSKSYCLKRKN